MISMLTGVVFFTHCTKKRTAQDSEEKRQAVREQKERLYDYENAENLDDEDGTVMAVEGDGLVASNSPTGQFKVSKIDEYDLSDLNKSPEPLEVHNASADSFITVD